MKLNFKVRQQLERYFESQGCEKSLYYTDLEAESDGQKPIKISWTKKYDNKDYPVLSFEENFDIVFFANIQMLVMANMITLIQPIKDVLNELINAKNNI